MKEVKCIVWVENNTADIDLMIDGVSECTTFASLDELKKNVLESANKALDYFGESVKLDEIVFVFKN